MAQVMEILPIGRSTLYEAVRTGQLCASHVGRRIVVSVDDLVEYIHKSD
ncbi:helix-turn-helix domain-containing protein [Allofournierella sp. CML151]